MLILMLLPLSSDDPDVVTAGLKEFENTILQQHDALETFGYIGRSSFASENGLSSTDTLIEPQYPPSVNGLLKAFIQSSPDAEELFVLWDLPGRDDDRKLCAFQMRCMAAMLFCSKSDDLFSNKFAARVIRDHLKSIYSQLGSSSASLVHSTLGILLSVCRTSSQNCKDVYSKVIVPQIALLSTLSQKGKESSHEVAGIKIHTDARFFIILIVLKILQTGDHSIITELLAEKSLLRALSSSVHKDSFHGTKVFLEGLVQLLPGTHLFRLFDSRFQQKIFLMYGNENPEIQNHVHNFVQNVFLRVASSSTASAKPLAHQLLKNLDAMSDMRHRELQILILKSQPGLLVKCISTMPACNFKSLSQIVFYLDNLRNLYLAIDIDSSMKQFVKSLLIGGKSDDEMKDFASSAVCGLFPSCLSKKEFHNLLTHANSYVALMAIELLHAALVRTHRILGDSCRKLPRIEGFVSQALFQCIPEIHVLLAARSRFSNFTTSTKESDEAQGDDKRQKNEVLLLAILKCIEAICSVLPYAFTKTNFDMLRLLDDIVSWSPATCLAEVQACICATNPALVHTTLKILSQVLGSSSLSWFGSKEESVKSISSLIFTTGWSEVVKKSPLAKLMLLASTAACPAIKEASKLLKSILVQIGLFNGYGVGELDLSLERISFLDSIGLKDDNVIIFDIILRASFHWNVALCQEMQAKLGLLEKPHVISSVLYCGLLMATEQFHVFIADLPRNAQQQITNANATSLVPLEKYAQGFGSAIQSYVLHMVALLSSYKSDQSAFLISIKSMILPIVENETNIKFIASISSLETFTAPTSALSFESENTTILHAGSLDHYCRLLSTEPDILRSLPQRAVFILDKILFFLARRCFKTGIGFSDNILFRAVEQHISNISSQMLDDEPSLDILICILIQGINLFVEFSTFDIGEDPVSQPSEVSRKRKSPRNIVTPSSKLPAVKPNIVGSATMKALTWHLIDVVRRLAGARVGVEILNNAGVHHFIAGKSLFSSCCRGLLLSSSLAYSKRYISELKKSDGILTDDQNYCTAYFESIADVVISELVEKNQDSYSASFPHMWLLQMFLDTPKVREAFSRMALSEEFGSMFLNVAKPVKDNLNEAHLLMAVSNLAQTVLKEVSFSSLVSSFKALSGTKTVETLSIENFDMNATATSSDSGGSNLLLGTTINCVTEAGLVSLAFYFDAPTSLKLLSRNKILPNYIEISRSKLPVPLNLPTQLELWRSHLHRYIEQYYSVPTDSFESSDVINCLASSLINGEHKELYNSCTKIINVIDASDLSLFPQFNFLKLNLLMVRDSELISFIQYAFLPVGITMLANLSEEAEISANWIEALDYVVGYYLIDSLALLKKLKRSNSEVDKESLLLNLKIAFELVHQSNRDGYKAIMSMNPNEKSEFTIRLNKVIKYSLQLGFSSDVLVFIVDKVLDAFPQFLSDDAKFTLSPSRLASTDFYHPVFLFRLITGHSDFKTSIVATNASRIFYILLRLLNTIFTTDQLAIFLSDIQASEMDAFLKTVLSCYKGTTSDGDRLILRVLSVLHDYEKAPALSLLSLHHHGSSGSNPSLLSSSWIFNALSPPNVYSSISSFPCGRRALAVPFEFETESVQLSYSTKLEASAIFSLKEDDQIEDIGSISRAFDTYSSQNLPRELLSTASNGLVVYDPTFWIPAFFQSLSIGTSSNVREAANSGLLSLTLASLSSDCSILRTYALACLQKVVTILESKLAEKDTLFRERPQLLALMNFVRNSIGENDFQRSSGEFVCPCFPASSTVFFARAALHLLQPTHDLYGSINKYLLMKPYFDSKDLPLYEIVVLNGDVQTDVLQILAVLRIVRDGLVKRVDHLNLCRKNTYIHLMLRLPLLMKDIRLAHAALDIFDKALELPSGCRYLFERCGYVGWMGHFISVSAICTEYSLSTSNNSTCFVLDDGRKGKDIQNTSSFPQTLRVFGRVLSMLRKSVIGDYLLSFEGVKSQYSEFNAIICMMSDDIVNLDSYNLSYLVNIENIKNFVHLLWDGSILNMLNGFPISWGVQRLLDLAMHVQSRSSLSASDEREKTVITLQIILTIGLMPIREVISTAETRFKVLNLLESTVVKALFTSSSDLEGFQFLGTNNTIHNSQPLTNFDFGNVLRLLTFIVQDTNQLDDKWKCLVAIGSDCNDQKLSSGALAVLYLCTLTKLKLLTGIEKESLSQSASIVRSTLLFVAIHDEVTASEHQFSLIRTLMASIDHSDSMLYEREFCEFQFRFRSCLIAMYVFLNTEEFSCGDASIDTTIKSSFRLVLSTMLILEHNPDILTEFLLYEAQNQFLTDGHSQWSQLHNRILHSKLCTSILELIALAVSWADKIKSASTKPSLADFNLFKQIVEEFANTIKIICDCLPCPLLPNKTTKTSSEIDKSNPVILNNTNGSSLISRKRLHDQVFSPNFLHGLVNKKRYSVCASMKEAAKIPLTNLAAETF